MLVAASRHAHQLRALVPAPARIDVSLAALTEGPARPVPRATSARRLLARVRQPVHESVDGAAAGP